MLMSEIGFSGGISIMSIDSFYKLWHS